jgi:hypothetical protein
VFLLPTVDHKVVVVFLRHTGSTEPLDGAYNYSELGAFKGTVQRDESACNWSHLVDLHEMERRREFQRILPDIHTLKVL